MRTAARILLALVMLCIGAALVLFLLLPSLIENFALSEIRTRTGLTDFSFRVSRMSTSGAELNDLRLGSPGKPVIRVGSVRLDFSLDGLKERRIDRLSLADISVRLVADHDGTRLDGWQPPKIDSSSDKVSPAELHSPVTLPVRVDAISIEGAQVLLRTSKGSHRLPFALSLSPVYGDAPNHLTAVAFQAELLPRDQTIQLRGNADLVANQVSVHAEGAPDFARLADIVGHLGEKSAMVSGTIPFTASLAAGLSPFVLHLASLEADLAGLQSTARGVTISGLAVGENGSGAHLSASLRDDKLDLSLTDLTVVSEHFPGRFNAKSITFSRLSSGFEGSGDFLLKLEAGDGMAMSSLQRPLTLSGSLRASGTAADSWQAELSFAPVVKKQATKLVMDDTQMIADVLGLHLSGSAKPGAGIAFAGTTGLRRISMRRGKDEIAFSSADLSLSGALFDPADFTDSPWRVEGTVSIPEIGARLTDGATFKTGLTLQAKAATGTGRKGEITASGRCELRPLVATRGEDRVALGQAHFDAAGVVVPQAMKLNERWQARFFGEFPEIAAQLGAAGNLHGALSLKGKVRPDSAGIPELGGTVTVKDFIANHPSSKLSVGPVGAHVPWHWPMVGKNSPAGTISVDAVSWKEKLLAKIDIDLTQEGDAWKIAAKVSGQALPGTLDMTGAVSPLVKGGPKAELTVALPETRLAGFSPGSLGVTSQITVDGLVKGQAIARYQGGRVDASGDLDLKDATISLPDSGTTVKGISTRIVFPDLVAVRSDPARLVFDAATVGSYLLEQGQVDFQLQSASSILIEKSHFSWSGGTVRASALRLYPERGDFTVDLYCDRLNIGRVLTQFGVRDVEGDGAVNGSIPVEFSGGHIFLGDGFLYSTPGDGGIIRLGAGDFLSAGIPVNTPQFMQVDFAAAALKSFRYDWVKIDFVSELEDVVMQMKMFGRPEKPLPFSYDGRIGVFRRLNTGVTGGITQPIQLDVNFRIPFNELLGYGKSMQQVLDMLQ